MGFIPIALLTFGYIGASCWLLISNDMHWERVGLTELGNSYNQWVPLGGLFAFRLLVTILNIGTVLYVVFDQKGLHVTNEVEGVKKVFTIKYLERLTMFTVWAWMLQGIYFIFASTASYCVMNVNSGNSPILASWVPRVAWVIYEVSLPVSIMVSFVVKFVLLPTMKKNKVPTDIFFTPAALIFHNLNVLFMAVEFAVSGLPIMFWHFGFIFILVGIYCVFSWGWYQYKGLFYYFFTDYHRADSFLWQLALLAVFYAVYMLCCGCSFYHMTSSSPIPTLIIIVVAFACLKFTP